jgi:hypothetical protein
VALREAVLTREATPPSLLRSDVPPELDIALIGSLRRQAAHRTANGKELHDRLCLIRGVAAPYPHGKAELASFIQEAIARQKSGAPSVDPWKLAAPSPGGQAPEVTEEERATVAARKR